jgi:hypothetical protein
MRLWSIIYIKYTVSNRNNYTLQEYHDESASITFIFVILSFSNCWSNLEKVDVDDTKTGAHLSPKSPSGDTMSTVRSRGVPKKLGPTWIPFEPTQANPAARDPLRKATRPEPPPPSGVNHVGPNGKLGNSQPRPPLMQSMRGMPAQSATLHLPQVEGMMTMSKAAAANSVCLRQWTAR